MSKKTQLIILIFIAVIFFTFGYVFSFLRNNISVNNNDTFKAGWEAAKNRLIEGGFVRTNNLEVRQVFGEIKEINGDKITLNIRPVEPLADKSLDTRVIVIGQATKIYNLEMKDSKEYEAEVNAYNKITPDKRPADIPDSFKKSEISLSDLKVGQMISAQAGENIKEVKEFNVIEIDYTKPVVPFTAPAKILTK